MAAPVESSIPSSVFDCRYTAQRLTAVLQARLDGGGRT
jgi:hypothetical protein